MTVKRNPPSAQAGITPGKAQTRLCAWDFREVVRMQARHSARHRHGDVKRNVRVMKSCKHGIVQSPQL